MMDCIQAIRARRSIRKFKPGGAIPKADLEQMLEAAMLAPSACNTRPWEFYVVENPEVKARLSASHPYAKMLDTASAAIVVCARPEAQEGICQGYWPLDCGAAVENLLLQAAGILHLLIHSVNTLPDFLQIHIRTPVFLFVIYAIRLDRHRQPILRKSAEKPSWHRRVC